MAHADVPATGVVIKPAQHERGKIGSALNSATRLRFDVQMNTLAGSVFEISKPLHALAKHVCGGFVI